MISISKRIDNGTEAKTESEGVVERNVILSENMTQKIVIFLYIFRFFFLS